MIRVATALLLSLQVGTSSVAQELSDCHRERANLRTAALLFRGELAKCSSARTLDAAAPPQEEKELERLSEEVKESPAPPPASVTPWWVWPVVGVGSALAFVGGFFVGRGMR